MIEARIKQGRLSFAESEYLLASLNGLADGAPNSLISKMHDMAVAKGELKPYSVVWWDEKCDRIVFDLEAANLVRHKRGARHLKPATDSPYDCYRIVSPCLSAEQLEHAREILDCLDPRIRFKSAKLTDDPGFLLDNEEPLRALSSWLARRAESASEVSTRERCNEIWDDEKAFDEGGMRRLLKAISFDFSLLKVHDSENEEYSRYIPPDEGFVIISENQDMWHSMRCLIEKGSLSMDGCRIRGVVFGNGKMIEADGCRRITKFLSSLNIRTEDVRYIGDIDPEGIAIQQAVEDGAGIRPWVYMYQLMGRLHRQRLAEGHGMRPHLAQSKKGSIARFRCEVMGPYADDARLALDAQARIPQEIVTLETLKEMDDEQ